MKRFSYTNTIIIVTIGLSFWLSCFCMGELRIEQIMHHIKLNPQQELVLPDAEDIKAFFDHMNSMKNGKDNARAERAFLGGTQPGVAVGKLFAGPGTTNLINAAGSLLGAAAAAAQQQQQQAIAAAAQQQQQQTVAVMTAMTPAQQIMSMRGCPAVHPAVCAPAAQCLLAGGVSIGNCAMGLMVCCTQKQEIPQSCSSTNNLISIRDKLSTIASSDEVRSCQYEIYKSHLGICQIQLDFDAFEMDRPMWGEDCSPDSVMTISDSVTVKNGFPLCGIQNGTRLYLGFGRSSRVTLSFTTRVKSTFKIRIKQIDCTSPERIPDQCLQNHEGHTGLVKSFGFPNYMINNQKYTICINAKTISDQGKITWRECSIQESGSDSQHNFLLSEYFIAETPPEVNNETELYYSYFNYYSAPIANLFLPAEGASCLKTTHVDIHGGDMHCGARFLSSSKYLRSESRPYMLTVNVVEDAAGNLPDFNIFRIPGIPRLTSTGKVPENLPENDCEYVEPRENTRGPNSRPPPPPTVEPPSTQGFDPCTIITKEKTGNVQYDICLCTKKEGSTIPEKPKSRPDLLERKGFCLHYAVS